MSLENFDPDLIDLAIHKLGRDATQEEIEAHILKVIKEIESL